MHLLVSEQDIDSAMHGATMKVNRIRVHVSIVVNEAVASLPKDYFVFVVSGKMNFSLKASLPCSF